MSPCWLFRAHPNIERLLFLHVVGSLYEEAPLQLVSLLSRGCLEPLLRLGDASLLALFLALLAPLSLTGLTLSALELIF